MVRYRHTQTTWLTPSIAALVGLFITTVLVLEDGPLWLLLVLLPVLALLALLFSRLTVEATDDRLRAFFGAGWPSKTVALDRIASVEQVTTSWVWGWGIRLTPHGTLYNVAGTRGVEVRLRSGVRFRLGSDEPERLCEAIRGALQDQAAA